jgi:enterochelin esterase family protein
MLDNADAPTSPRIAALAADLARGEASALPDFWRTVEREGTPLVEPIALDADHYLVTFLWRQTTPDLENVVVCSHALGWSFRRNRMTRLAGTDLWYRTYRLPAATRTWYNLSPNDSLVYLIDMDDRAARMSTWRPDPLARRSFVFPRDEEMPGDEEWLASMIELPGAPAPTWSASQPEVPRCHVELFRVRSALLDNERRVWVYTPPGYTAGPDVPYPLLVVFDGFAYLRAIPTPTILDNLIAAARIAPCVALFVDNVDRDRELPCYPPFADFLAGELLPWALERYAVTADPARTTVAGSSYGGLAAVYAGYHHPEVFGNVISQSGAYWWRPEEDVSHEWWLIRELAASPRLPLRFYLDVGIFENGFKDPSMLVANRYMRDVLRAKEYPVHYAEYAGGHDYPCWEVTLPEALIALCGGEIGA